MRVGTLMQSVRQGRVSRRSLPRALSHGRVKDLDASTIALTEKRLAVRGNAPATQNQ